MAKEILLETTETMEIDGVTVLNPDGTDKEFYSSHVVKATPKFGGSEYIRMHLADGSTYLWNAPTADWNNTISDDPLAELRWEVE